MGTPALRARRAPPSPPACSANVVRRSVVSCVSSGVMGRHAIEALGEDVTWSIRQIAEPASAMDSEPHSAAAPRQVERPPKEAAVLVQAQFPTTLGTERLGV